MEYKNIGRRSGKTYLLIKELTERIIKEYNINQYPLDIMKLCEKLGFDVVKKDLGNFPSAILYNEEYKVIFLNKKLNIAQRRFYIANEIGACFLNNQLNGTYAHKESYVDMYYTSKETLFALLLLMPEKEVCEIIRKTKNGLLRIYYMQSKFGVSYSDAKYRLRITNND